MPVSNISKKVAAEKTHALNLATGLSQEELQGVAQEIGISEVEKKIASEAIHENLKKLILQEIRVDQYNTLRRYVELTPSMCQVRGCGFDAAREIGIAAGWGAARVDQMLANGKTLGQRIIEVLEYHNSAKHGINTLNDHIITEEDHKRKSAWTPGQQVYL